MLIKLLNIHNDMILVNTDHIVKVKPYNNGIAIRFTNGESEELIPNMTMEEFLVKTTANTDIISKLESLEHTIECGFQRLGRSSIM